MSLLAIIRHHQRRASRLVTAVFAIGWLGFAFAPCQASPQHESMPANDCGHCPATASDPSEGCATIAAPECLLQGQALIEPRDAGNPQPPAGPPPAFLDFSAFVPDGGMSADARARLTPVSRVSLQQRYCSYLK